MGVDDRDKSFGDQVRLETRDDGFDAGKALGLLAVIHAFDNKAAGIPKARLGEMGLFNVRMEGMSSSASST